VASPFPWGPGGPDAASSWQAASKGLWRTLRSVSHPAQPSQTPVPKVHMVEGGRFASATHRFCRCERLLDHGPGGALGAFGVMERACPPIGDTSLAVARWQGSSGGQAAPGSLIPSVIPLSAHPGMEIGRIESPSGRWLRMPELAYGQRPHPPRPPASSGARLLTAVQVACSPLRHGSKLGRFPP